MKLIVNQQILRAGLAPAQLFNNLRVRFKKAMQAGIAFFIFMVSSFYSSAQGGADSTMKMRPAEMANTMRSNGKIYVVVAVLVIILAGLFFYLIRLDRKITRLEKGNWKES